MQGWEQSGHASRSRVLYASGVLSSLSFYGPSINYCLASNFGYQFSEITTAIIMYFFAMAALLVGSVQMKAKASWTAGVVLVMLSMCGMSVLWVINYVVAHHSLVEFSQYDYKRPAFAFYGFVVFGLIGIIASRDPASFLRGLLKVSAVCSLILAVLYLPLYDSSSDLSRIGGDAGLITGILLSQGVTSILAMIWLGWFNYKAALLCFPVLISAMLMSGTRSALSVAVLAMVVSGAIQVGRSGGVRVILYSLVLMAIVCFGYFVLDFFPEKTLTRITSFKLEGSEDRLALLASAWGIFCEYPFGKAAGYVGLFPAEIEYSHNATVQIILEAGLFSIPLLLLLLFGAMRAVWVGDESRRRVLRSFLFYAIGVYLVSLSAGDAYNAQYWFVTSLLAASGLSFFRRQQRGTCGVAAVTA